MQLHKVDFLVDVPRGGRIEQVQCYIRSMSAWAAREYRTHIAAGESERAVASIVHHCCVTEKYAPAFTEDEALKEIDGDQLAELFELINQRNEVQDDTEKKS